MPTLNYTTPLHSFTSGNLTFTATKECYLTGTIATNNDLLRINGNLIANANAISGVTYDALYIPPLKLTSGDTVTVVQAENMLHVFEEIS